MSERWHADVELLARYREGRIDAAAAFSIESHLAVCATCQGTAAELVDPAQLERVWAGVAQEIDRPRGTWTERLLAAVGVPDHLARLLAATPSLRAPWIVAVCVVVAAAVAGAHLRPMTVLWFLVVAPLVPLAGVATAFGPGLDPTYEVGLAAPFRGIRLLLLRAVAVLVVSMSVCGMAAVLLPGVGITAAVWILPALALTATGLAAATFAPPVPAAIVVGGVWTLGALGVELASVQQLAVFGEAGQLGAVTVGLVALGVLAARARTFDEGRWVSR